MPVGQTVEDVFEIGIGLAVVELGVSDQRADYSSVSDIAVRVGAVED